jgi:hypothetical protein
MSKLGYLIAAVLGLSAMGVAWQAWQAMLDVQMTTNGMIAMILGGLGAVALGAGLMALLFFSNRKGFDDRAGTSPVRKSPDDRPNDNV